jgi:hypothetical protein
MSRLEKVLYTAKVHTTGGRAGMSRSSRNAKAGQGIGYPMFTLERLYAAAELMQIAGFDPYGYRGTNGRRSRWQSSTVPVLQRGPASTRPSREKIPDLSERHILRQSTELTACC